jgi:hypothetical protein
MRKIGAVLALVGGLALASTSPAWADGFKSYRVCGGTTFATCAAVEITVVGQNVTMRVWNLSANVGATGGAAAGQFGGTILNGIGFYNVPAGVLVNTGSLAVNGPVRGTDDPQGFWKLHNFGSVAFSVDFNAATPRTSGGIASGCASAGELPGTPPDLFMNPCNSAFGNNANWVVFTFKIHGGSWDPSTSDISIRGYNGLDQSTTECWTDTSPNGLPSNCSSITTTPEPVTMTLLATGLAGMGGAGFFRRRRKGSQIV